MALGNLQFGSYKNATATGNVSPRAGALLGFYVNSTTAGTIIFYDSATTTTTTVITGTITPAIGWHSLPVAVANGIYAVVGGTLNVTFVYA